MHRSLFLAFLLLASAWLSPPCAGAQSSPDLPQDGSSPTTEAPAEPDELPSPPFPFTPRHLGRAGGHLGDHDLLLGLGVGSLAALAVSAADQEISDWFVEHEPLGPDAKDIGYWIGHRKTVGIATVVLTGSGLALGDTHLRDTGLLFIESHLVVAGVTQLVKEITGRTRPDGSNDRSLPSGHASSAMTSARVLQMRYGWWVGAPAYALAAYTGLSRVQGNKHYLSDVVFGWTLAWYLSSAIVRAAEPRPGERGHEEKTVLWMPPPEIGDSGLALLRVRF